MICFASCMRIDFESSEPPSRHIALPIGHHVPSVLEVPVYPPSPASRQSPLRRYSVDHEWNDLSWGSAVSREFAGRIVPIAWLIRKDWTTKGFTRALIRLLLALWLASGWLKFRWSLGSWEHADAETVTNAGTEDLRRQGSPIVPFIYIVLARIPQGPQGEHQNLNPLPPSKGARKMGKEVVNYNYAGKSQW